MKKILATIIGLALLSGVAYAGQAGSRQLVGSSGLLTADTAVKATGGVVYGITGQAVGADVLVHLVNGDISDSTTDASQYISIGVGVDNDPINVSIPNGVYFSDGIYYYEETGAADVTVLYE